MEHHTLTLTHSSSTSLVSRLAKGRLRYHGNMKCQPCLLGHQKDTGVQGGEAARTHGRPAPKLSWWEWEWDPTTAQTVARKDQHALVKPWTRVMSPIEALLL